MNVTMMSVKPSRAARWKAVILVTSHDISLIINASSKRPLLFPPIGTSYRMMSLHWAPSAKHVSISATLLCATSCSNMSAARSACFVRVVAMSLAMVRPPLRPVLTHCPRTAQGETPVVNKQSKTVVRRPCLWFPTCSTAGSHCSLEQDAVL